MFQGFSQNAIDFLWGIRFNNERSWFEPRKGEYQQYVLEPMKELAVQTQMAMLERFPDLQLQVKVSRIYRDARRLFGRGPYKDHMWFVLHRPQDERGGAIPAFYFEIAPQQYSIGMGYYSATPLTMAKFRARLEHDPAPMEKLARRLARQDKFVLEGDQYARPKKQVTGPLAPWYNRKNVALLWEQNCEGSLFTPALADEVLESFVFLEPYFRYFDSLAGDREPGTAE